MNIKRVLNALLHGVVGAVVTFVIGVFVISFFSGVELIKPYVVQSGSMEPAIKTASVVFSIPQKSYNPGDVITFAQGGNYENLITHRIDFKLYPDGVENPPVYITSGDANEEFDRWEVINEDVVGKVVFSIPYLGYAVDFAKQPYGFILLVIVPATIVIYEELKVVGREVYKFLKKVREEIRIKVFVPKKASGPASGPEGWPTARREKEEVGLPRGRFAKTYIEIDERTIDLTPNSLRLVEPMARTASILLPVLGSALVLISLTASFFFDIELSTGNILGAANSFGETANLYDSIPYTCPSGASNTGGTVFGTVTISDTSTDIEVDVTLVGATPSSSYDIWINQDPGGCPLSSPTATGAIVTDGSGNGTGSASATKVGGATSFWISAVGGGQVLRSTAVGF